jgi:outer membrane lipoprotein carrier protein
MQTDIKLLIMQRKPKFNSATFSIMPIRLTILMVLCLTVSGFTDNSASVFKNIQATFDQISNIHTFITQTNTDTSSKTATTYAGEVFFQKPDKLKIHYSKPAEQTMVFDGEFLWIYTIELKQITKQKLESGAIPIPLLFFAGASNIDAQAFRKKNFISPVKLETINSVSTYRIRIRPKSKTAPFKEQLFWIDTATFMPVKARISDSTGIVVTIAFSKVESDIDISNNTFSIPIPSGVELVDLTTTMK